MREEHEAEVSGLKSGHEEALKQAEEKAKAEADKQNARIAELEGQLASKEEEIKTLSEAAAQVPAPKDPPKGNESGESQEYQGFKSGPVCKEGMSWAEKAEAAKAREQELIKARRR